MVSTSVIAAQPLLTVGRIAAAGTHIVCVPCATYALAAAAGVTALVLSDPVAVSALVASSTTPLDVADAAAT